MIVSSTAKNEIADCDSYFPMFWWQHPFLFLISQVIGHSQLDPSKICESYHTTLSEDPPIDGRSLKKQLKTLGSFKVIFISNAVVKVTQVKTV